MNTIYWYSIDEDLFVKTNEIVDYNNAVIILDQYLKNENLIYEFAEEAVAKGCFGLAISDLIYIEINIDRPKEYRIRFAYNNSKYLLFGNQYEKEYLINNADDLRSIIKYFFENPIDIFFNYFDTLTYKVTDNKISLTPFWYIVLVAIFVYFVSQGNPICNNFSCGYDYDNASFNGDLGEWYPFITINDTGEVVTTFHEDFVILNDRETNEKYLEIRNDSVPNQRSSISQSINLDKESASKYILSFKIRNKSDLSGKKALVFARISFLDIKKDIIKQYHWAYFDKKISIINFIQKEVYINSNYLGDKMNKDWRNISVDLEEVINEKLSPEQADKIRMIRFSTGIFNYEKEEIVMDIDEIHLKKK